MNKQSLINTVAAEAGLTKVQAKRAVNAVLDLIESSLKKGERVSLVGFGTFQTRTRASRMGLNPRTGEQVRIAAARTPILAAGRKMKEAVSGGTDDPGPSIGLSKRTRK